MTVKGTTGMRNAGSKLAASLVIAGIVVSCLVAHADVGPKWPTDKYKAFAESAKKNKLLFLYYTSTS